MITKIAGAAKLLAVGIPLVTSALTALLVKINMVGVQSLIASGGFTGMQAASLLAAKWYRKSNFCAWSIKNCNCNYWYRFACCRCWSFGNKISSGNKKE